MSSTTSFLRTGNESVRHGVTGSEILITRTFLLHAWTLMLLPGNFYNMR